MLPPSVREWAERGATATLDGDRYFIVDIGPRSAPTIVLLHGFPGSTFEWRRVVNRLTDRWRVVSFDYLGFGLSDKPPAGDYSLVRQADRAEQLFDRAGIDTTVIVAHDVGDTIAAELLQRANGDQLHLGVAGAVLFNGSIFIDLVQLSAGQEFLLALPDEVLAESFGTDATANGLRASFPAGLPDEAELEAMVALVHRKAGDRLMPRIIRYIEERRRNQDRWTAGLGDFTGPVAAFWGDLDPIAVPAMADRLVAVRTDAGNPITLEHWPDVGHWPIVEAPDRVAAAIDSCAAAWFAPPS